MKLDTVEVTTFQEARVQAREHFAAYRRAVQEGKDPQQRKDDTILMRAYREIARGRAVLDVSQVIKDAGIREDDWYPKLAICRADAQWCTVEMKSDGSVTFYAGTSTYHVAKDKKIILGAGTLPRYQMTFGRPGQGGEHSSRTRFSAHWQNEAKAVVPTIPPQFRPPFKLEGYHLLWEAVWQRIPPVDPILLKHMGGNLFAVLAQWDLSPLERSVLGGRL